MENKNVKDFLALEFDDLINSKDIYNIYCPFSKTGSTIIYFLDSSKLWWCESIFSNDTLFNVSSVYFNQNCYILYTAIFDSSINKF